MAAQDSKLTGLTELTSATADDILYIVNDPSGVALGQKITVANLFNYTSFGTANTLAKFSSGGGLEDSSITDNGTTVTITSLFDVVGDTEIDGDLNVGTTSVSRVLDVYGSLNQYSSTGNSQRVQLDLYATGPTGTRARQAAIGAIRNSGDDGGQLEFFVTNSGGTLFEAANLEDDAFNVNVATNISANLAVDTDTLFVDATNDRVGINNPSPARNLSVASDTSVVVFQLSNSTTGLLADTGFEFFISGTSAGIVNRENGAIRFDTNNTQRGEFSASGNFIVDTDTLFVDATNDRVGINNSSPNVALDVVGNAEIDGTLNVTGDISAGASNTTGLIAVDGTERGGGVFLQRNGVFTSGVFNRGAIVGDTTEGLALFAETGLGIDFIVNGNPTIIGMSIDSSGNLAVDTDTLFVDATNDSVGINTTNAYDLLTVSGGASGSYGISIDNSLIGGGVKAVFQYDADNAIAVLGGNSTNGISFRTLTLGSLTEKMTLDDSGNLAVDTDTLFVDASTGRVGIQNASPSVALDVVGDAKISGTINGQTISTGTNAAVASGTWINTVAAVDGNFYEIYGKTEVATSNVRYYNQVMVYNSGTVQGLGISSSLNMEFQVSGGNLQLRQTTGAARDIIWTVIKRN